MTTPPEYVDSLIANVATVTQEALTNIQSPSQLMQLLDGIYGFCETFLDHISRHEPPPQPINCSNGCWYCCLSKRIEVLPIELIVIAHFLQTQDHPLAKSQWPDLLNNDTSQPPSSTVQPCPMLVDSSCAIYPIRPFVCRSFNSYDSNACKMNKTEGQNTPIFGYLHQGYVYQATLSGIAQGCRNRGLDAELIDLRSTLADAMENLDGFTQKWLDGKDTCAAEA